MVNYPDTVDDFLNCMLTYREITYRTAEILMGAEFKGLTDEMQFTLKPYQVSLVDKLREHFPGSSRSDMFRKAMERAVADSKSKQKTEV